MEVTEIVEAESVEELLRKAESRGEAFLIFKAARLAQKGG
jgi:hypothetical protein